MKRTLFIVIFLCLISISLLGQTEIKAYTDLDYAPWFNELSYSLYCTTVNLLMFFGMQIGSVTLGTDIYTEYFSFDGQDENNLLQGACFSAGGNLDFHLAIGSTFTLKAGAGGYWTRWRTNLNQLGWLSLEQPGIALNLNAQFQIIKQILYIEIINRVNINLNLHPTVSIQTLPLYTGGVRLTFSPGLSWLRFYGEAKAVYWVHETPLMDFTTLMGQIKLGVSMNLIQDNAARQSSPVIKEKQLPAIEKLKMNVSIAPEPIPEVTIPELLPFIKGAPGDKIILSTICFQEESSRLQEESIAMVDQLIELLKKNTSISFTITGYTEPKGNPIEEFNQCRNRASALREYLIINGIGEERITISNKGIFISDADKNKNIYSKVAFTIINM